MGFQCDADPWRLDLNQAQATFDPGDRAKAEPSGYSQSDQVVSICREKSWLRELDLNQRPSGYEPDELPDCSIPRYHF